jgi:hypothetical protein
MPIHFNDLDVVSEVEGLNSALIVPCIMRPATTESVRESKSFIQLFKGLGNLGHIPSTIFQRISSLLDSFNLVEE